MAIRLLSGPPEGGVAAPINQVESFHDALMRERSGIEQRLGRATDEKVIERFAGRLKAIDAEIKRTEKELAQHERATIVEDEPEQAVVEDETPAPVKPVARPAKAKFGRRK